MKRILVSCCALIFLSSCKVTDNKINYPLYIDSTVTAVCEGSEFIASVRCNGNGQLTAEISEPNDLYGTVLVFSDDNVTVKNDEISLTYDKNFAVKIPLYQVNSALEYINLQNPDFVAVGDELSTEFQIDKCSFKVVLDSNTQKLKCIKTENCIFEFI